MSQTLTANKRKRAKLHKGKAQDCPRCRHVELGLDEAFRQIAPKKKAQAQEETRA